jgi:sugar lactone lactonase YvrE
MKMQTWALCLLSAFAFSAHADSDNEEDSAAASQIATVTTLITTPLVIEGLTNDGQGNLYAPGRALNAADPCPVYRTSIANPTLTTVGLIPASTPTCSPSGLAFGPDGQLYVTQTDRIYRFTPSATGTPPTATLFASGVPGTNGLAFDWNGNLWTGDGTTGVGRVWRISPQGVVTEVFRIQPMANEVNLVAGVGGVGRDARTLGPGTITVTPTSRNAANTLGSQPLVANGLAFDRSRNLYIADSARGALWRVRVNRDSTVSPKMGCDTTFTPNTLCLSHIFIAHPLLDGVDGIVIDAAGNIWADSNERNAIIFVAGGHHVVEVFRNAPDAATQLRNTGPLETPTSPVLVDHKFCTANSDGNRRDNFPSTAGEISPAGPARGKISCIDQRVTIPGISLPIH